MVSPDQWIRQLAEGLNPSSRTPLYEQLTHAIGQAIKDGTLPLGTPLPNEPELAQRVGVSRVTMNQALTALAKLGLVTRRRGIGTFVAEPYVEQTLDQLYSFVETLTAQGRVPGMRLLGYRVTLDDDASPLLTGRADGLVLELSRLRLMDGEPFVVEDIYLPVECDLQASLGELTKTPLYDLLQNVCGIHVTRAEETLRPVLMESDDAALLGLAVGEPAFLIERHGYADRTRTVEFRRSLIRGDRFRFRVHLDSLIHVGIRL